MAASYYSPRRTPQLSAGTWRTSSHKKFSQMPKSHNFCVTYGITFCGWMTSLPQKIQSNVQWQHLTWALFPCCEWNQIPSARNLAKYPTTAVQRSRLSKFMKPRCKRDPFRPWHHTHLSHQRTTMSGAIITLTDYSCVYCHVHSIPSEMILFLMECKFWNDDSFFLSSEHPVEESRMPLLIAVHCSWTSVHSME